MLDYNKESLNLSRTQCGPFINLQICSLLWLKVLSVLIESLIRFDQKFWSSSTESFHQFWLEVWSSFYQPRSSPTESFDQVWLKVFDQVWLEVLIKFDWKFHQFWLKVLIKLLSILVESSDQAFINSDQVRLKVLIRFEWKFSGSQFSSILVGSLIKLLSIPIKSDWKFWSSLIEFEHLPCTRD